MATATRTQKQANQNETISFQQKNEKALQPAENQTLAMSERFTNQVLKEFGNNVVGAIQVTDYQRQLIQGYFIGIDRALKKAEEDRLRKNAGNKDKQYDNTLPVVWANVNLNDLALDVVHYAKMGLDMMQDNHLAPVPYKNKKTQKYDLTLMPGYNGIQYIAEKYAVEKPLMVTVELVYSTDTFKPIKKSKDNRVESYEFEINNAFDRGSIVGGFGYIEYADPVKNKLIIMTIKDIEKRKPKYAAAEFWGGKKVEWVDGKKQEVETEGWYEEMVLKTVKREAYSAKHIPRDPKKIDDNYQYMRMREARFAEMEAQAEIDANANAIIIDTTLQPQSELPPPSVDPDEVNSPEKPAEAAPAQDMPAGPNF